MAKNLVTSHKFKYRFTLHSTVVKRTA